MQSLPSRRVPVSSKQASEVQAAFAFVGIQLSEFDEPERWLPVPGWPGYDVSDIGRVRSYWRRGRAWHKYGPLGTEPKIVGGYPKASGHIFARLICYRDGVRKVYFVGIHSLVLEAFVGPRPSGMEACHNNGIASDNHLSNLRWDTLSANRLDRLDHGQQTNQVLQTAEIPTIWARIVAGEELVGIAQDYGVSDATISCIKNGQRWSHITSKLPGWPLPSPWRHHREPIYIHGRYAKSKREIWKFVPDWPQFYRVSNFGRLQSRLDHGRLKTDGTYRLAKEWMTLNTSVPNRDGHIRVTLYNHGQPHRFFVHTLVLTAFACPRPQGMICCHIDGNPANNHAKNLRWDSRKSNSEDAVRHAAARTS